MLGDSFSNDNVPWPIDPFHALAFAGLLARSLIEHSDWFEAYVATLTDMMAGKESILERLSEINSDVTERVQRNNPEGLNDLLFWASPCFFE